MGLRDEITPALHASAKIDGVADIPTAWLKFCAAMVKKFGPQPCRVEAEWQMFYGRERGYESTTRAREARIAEEGKARLAKAREAKQDGNYTPPPVSREPEIVLAEHDCRRLGIPWPHQVAK